MNWLAIFFILSGIYLVSLSLATITKKPIIAVIYKGIPFFIGLLNFLYGLSLIGIIKIG